MSEYNVKLCMGCMRKNSGEEPCPFCGYKGDEVVPERYLQPKSVLKERYIVGKILSQNSEGVSYIGYDAAIEARVEIREYFPEDLAFRNKNGEILARSGKEAQFKALKLDFYELFKKLSSFRTMGEISRIFEIFEENNTIYVISEYVELVNFNQYLKDQMGEIPWDKAKELFMPLMDSVANLNLAGILHLGLSPETIYVTKSESLKVKGFSTISLRSSQMELKSELFSGYSAPEQYATNLTLDAYTDVYAVGAVLYKALTGTMPPNAADRMINDSFIPASQINPLIPKQISDVITAALALDTKARIQNIKDLIERFNVTDKYIADQTRVIPGPAVVKNNKQDKKSNSMAGKNDKNSNGENNSTVKVFLLTAICSAAVLLVGILIWMMFLNFGNTPDSSSSSDTGSSSSSSTNDLPDYSIPPNVGPDRHYATPDFKGKLYADLVNHPDYNKRFLITYEWDYNEEYEEGVIFAQTPEPDQPVKYLGDIVLKVSKGKRYYDIPMSAGYTYEEYIEKLYEMGFQKENIKTYLSITDDPNKAGYIESVEFTDTREKLKAGDKADILNFPNLTIYYYYDLNNPDSSTPETEE